MPARREESRLRIFLRVAGLVVAFGLAILAACLIAFGSSTKQIQLGVLAGLWSALLGTLCVNGIRHSYAARMASAEATSAVAVAPFPPAPPGPAPTMAAAISAATAAAELEVRRVRGLESLRDAEARRSYERQLQEMVERELGNISRAMSSQLEELRTEVSQLRGELVEKVGGQLRLERIETTRVIGSDIEALQHEVRRLAFGRGSGGPVLGANSEHTIETSLAYGGAPLAPAPEPIAPAASIAPAAPIVLEPPSLPPLVPPTVPPTVLPPVPPTVLQPAPVPSVSTAAPVPTPAPVSDDPFASMPRLSRFVDSEPLLPIESPQPTSRHTDSSAAASVSPLREGGRRHRPADDEDREAPDDSPGGGRRRRAEGETNDVLARLLGTA
jgi:hypothetical protein